MTLLLRARRALAALLFCALLGAASHAQGTGAVFPTPSNQNAPGAAVLVPCGSITNGQPVYCPPGPQDPLAVYCTTCSPSAPVGASTNPVNGAITTGTGSSFQQLLASYAPRRGCTFSNTSGFGATAATPIAGGSGYVTGDTVTLAGGTGTNPTVLSVTASGGVVTGATVQSVGTYTLAPSGTIGQASTSGVGTAATFSVPYAPTVLYLSFGATPSLAAALPWYPGQPMYCSTGTNVAITDQINVNGPKGATFAGGWQ